jgi:putative YhbY family RNA-binding protein
MPEVPLSPKERQALKARAHGLKPVVLLGNAGASAPVIREIDRALAAHELIKVRVPGDDRTERDALFTELADTCRRRACRRSANCWCFTARCPRNRRGRSSRITRVPSGAKNARQPNTRVARAGKPSHQASTPTGARPNVNRPPARRDPGAAHAPLWSNAPSRAAQKRSGGR